MNTLTDWRGRTIAPGATVLYVGRFSSTVYVTEGTVLEVLASGSIRVQPVASTRWATPEGPSTLTALKNVTVLEEASNACEWCGDCYHPFIGPNTDGEPCDWCQECACPAINHTRMTYAEETP